MTRSCKGGHQCCVAAQRSSVGGEVEAAAVVGWDACSGGVGEPLLRHDLTFGSDGLTCHADPCALDDFGTSGQQAGGSAALPQRPGASGSWSRSLRRNAICIASGGERGVGVAWDSLEPCSGVRTGLGTQQRTAGRQQKGSSTWSRKKRFRVRDAQCCHPCLHSPGSAIPSSWSGGRAPCSTSSQEGTSVHPSTTSSLRASEAVRRQAGPRASVRQWTAQSEKGRAPFAQHTEGIGPGRPISRRAGARGLR